MSNTDAIDAQEDPKSRTRGNTRLKKQKYNARHRDHQGHFLDGVFVGSHQELDLLAFREDISLQSPGLTHGLVPVSC